MQIFDFKYITEVKSDYSLFDKISNFYTDNNKNATLNHVKSVANKNAEIAKLYGFDSEKCILSGLLHDISAVMKPQDMVIFAKGRGIDLDESEKKYPFLLHQQISKLFAIELFNINDEEILSPIACHTTLRDNPTKYDMSLFIADKLSWDQSGTPPFYDLVNNSLDISLEHASLQYINYVLKENMILHPHKWFLEAKAYLEGTIT